MIESISSYRLLEKKRILNRKDSKAEVRCKADFKGTVPNFFGISDQFHGRQFSHGPGGRESGCRMIQVHHTYCALYFYYYYISSTSDHQALDPGGWGPQI